MSANTPSNTTQLLLNAVPDGSTVSYNDFRNAVGNDVADLLSWANPQSISRNGNHVVLDCASAATHTSPSGPEITIQQKVEFDVDPNSTELSVKNVKGVKVKLSAIAMALKEAKLGRDANGNTTVTGKLEVSRWLPNIPFTVTLGPDGKPVP